MRLIALLSACLLFAACDSQEPLSGHPLVGSWTMDSTGTAESIVPTFSGAQANVVAPSISGEIAFSGDVSGRLRSAMVFSATPDGAREARVASYDLAGEEPESGFFVLTVSGDATSSVFQLFEQPATGSSRTYFGYTDSLPFTLDGDQVVLPAVELSRLGSGRPPLQLEGGAFTFPIVQFVAGETIELRRDVQPDNNPLLDLRYVFEADGTFRLEGFSPPDTSTVSTYKSGQWQANGDQLRLTQSPEPLGTPTDLTFALSRGRLVLNERLSNCQDGTNADCLDRLSSSFALPPGSVSAYERRATSIYSR